MVGTCHGDFNHGASMAGVHDFASPYNNSRGAQLPFNLEECLRDTSADICAGLHLSLPSLVKEEESPGIYCSLLKALQTNSQEFEVFVKVLYRVVRYGGAVAREQTLSSLMRVCSIACGAGVRMGMASHEQLEWPDSMCTFRGTVEFVQYPNGRVSKSNTHNFFLERTLREKRGMIPGPGWPGPKKRKG